VASENKTHGRKSDPTTPPSRTSLETNLVEQRRRFLELLQEDRFIPVAEVLSMLPFKRMDLLQMARTETFASCFEVNRDERNGRVIHFRINLAKFSDCLESQVSTD